MKPSPGPVSVFEALYSYDPGQMSPNPNTSSEVALKKGQVLLVFGSMREVSGWAGHYWGGRGTTGVGGAVTHIRAYVCLP